MGLALSMRNEAARHPHIAELLGSSNTWDVWAFEERPQVNLEQTQSALIVFVSKGTGVPVSDSSFFKAQEIDIDIWADSTRNPDGSIRVRDADDKIEAITDALNTIFHTVNLSAVGADGQSTGQLRKWGTEQEVQERRALNVLGSTHVASSRLRDVKDQEGARMVTQTYAVVYA